VTFPIQCLRIQTAVKNPPEAIYLQGSAEGIALLSELPQPRAESFVRRTLLELRKTDLIIVSGLALGIDACAHEAALEAGLPTVAFVGCGLNLQYPPENQELRNDILKNGGLIVSEHPPDQTALPHFFTERNRLIAGLSKATWVAQAPMKSGALNTAKWAREQHKTCYATPCFPGDPPFAGTEILIDQHDAYPVWNAKCFGRSWPDLLSTLASRRRKSIPRSDADPILNELYRRTAQSGGATTSDLLDWAFGQEISPAVLFERLQKAQECGSVSDRNGVLAAT